MKLTRKKTIEFHRELWGWLAETGDSNKSNWPGWEQFDDSNRPMHNCFLCEYTKTPLNMSVCKKCPLDWETSPYIEAGYQCESNGNGYFNKWNFTGSSQTRKRKKYAAIIRDLPERK